MSTVFDSAPYENVILTGPMGVGKTSVARDVVARLDAEYYDLENEILAREGQSAAQIRELFGEARLKTIEADTIREMALRRHAVLVVAGTALLEETNRARLAETGLILCMTCTLNEILRRLYIARGAWFQNPTNRGVILSRLKREMRLMALDLPQLDTTRLSPDDTTAAVIDFWLSKARF